MFFEVRGSNFVFASNNFEGTFIDFCFMMFAKVMMKELAHILIHVYKIFNCRVPSKYAS